MGDIDLTQYRVFFQTQEQSEIDALESLQPYFLTEGVSFESNYWAFREAPKEIKGLDFAVPIDSDQLLTDYPDLLRTVKISVMLAGTISDYSLGGISAEGTIRFGHDLINFIRLMRQKYGLKLISSLRNPVVEQMLQDYAISLAERLSIKPRLAMHLASLGDTDIECLQIARSTVAPEFNVDKIAIALGVSTRLLSSKCPVMLTQFKSDHNFFIKRSQLIYLDQEVDKQSEKRSADSIRKELANVKKAFRILTMFTRLIPEVHRLEADFLADISPLTFGRKHGRASRRTPDIPQPVMFKLMDRAIRWITDYADPLIDYRDRALVQYQKLGEGSHRGGTAESRSHYAGKRMRLWLERNPLCLDGPGSPSPINSFDRNYDGSRANPARKVTSKQIEELHILREKGCTFKEAGRAIGVSKASAYRLLNQGLAKEGLGLDQVLHCYLPTACLLVIYCFTARRQCEIETLEAGCCEETVNGPMIRMYTAKTYQEYDYFPTTRLVKKAVRVLERLTESVRSDVNQSLLQVPSLQGGHYDFWQSGKINEFSALVKANGDRAEQWVFSEHQFRRFFAMTYFYRYDAGDLPTLSWHLRHTNFVMTERYLTDPHFGPVFESVMAEKVADLALKPSVGGPMQNELEQLAENLELPTEKRAAKMIERVHRLGLVINHVPDGLCFGSSPSLKERSQCLYYGEVQRSSAAQGSCRGCSNLARFDCSSDVERVIDLEESPILQVVGGS